MGQDDSTPNQGGPGLKHAPCQQAHRSGNLASSVCELLAIALWFVALLSSQDLLEQLSFLSSLQRPRICKTFLLCNAIRPVSSASSQFTYEHLQLARKKETDRCNLHRGILICKSRVYAQASGASCSQRLMSRNSWHLLATAHLVGSCAAPRRKPTIPTNG